MSSYQKPSPLPPSRWEEYVVSATPFHDADGVESTSLKIPVVGSRQMGVDVSRSLDPKLVVIAGEPENPHDSTALAVLLATPGLPLAQYELIGYVPKIEKHWFRIVHPDTWKDPGFGIVYEDWTFTVYLPCMFAMGSTDFVKGRPVEHRGRFEDVGDRNWWLAGWRAAREAAALFSA